jgi:hypothetical protein
MLDRLAPESLLLWNGNTFQTALHLAFWLGCRRVHLVGCDFGGARDYHDGRTLDDPRRQRNRMLYRQLVDELPLIRLAAEKRGMEIVSCTPDSPANEYLRYVPLEEASERAAASVPAVPHGAALDAADAELCRWHRLSACAWHSLERLCHDKPGVMTGCDARQEWLLPWWWRHYRAHNGYPVAFADLGMTPAARAWCAARGSVVDVPVAQAFKPVSAQPGSAQPEKAAPQGWFAKPLAVLRSPFRWTLWLDLDCEVRGPLAEAFVYADRGLAVTADPYYPQENGDCPHFPPRKMGTVAAFRPSLPVLSTGVIGVRHGEPAVQTWAAQVFRRLERIRDDQAALNEIRDVCRESIVLMPRRFHHLRLAGEPPADALIVHWTGAEGKRLIRERISRDAGDIGDRDKENEQRQPTVQPEELIHV